MEVYFAILLSQFAAAPLSVEPYGQMKGGSAAISAAAKLTIKVVLWFVLDLNIKTKVVRTKNSFAKKASMHMSPSKCVSFKRDQKIDRYSTYLEINKELTDLYNELVFGECKSGTSEEHSAGHKDSAAENNTLRVALIFINQSSSDWCASQTTESDEEGRHS